jgi:hypothetical protein
MSDLLARLRNLDLERRPNAELLGFVDALDARNRVLTAEVLRLLDEQDELAHEYGRVMNALLTRQGGVGLTQESVLAEPPVDDSNLQDAWN